MGTTFLPEATTAPFDAVPVVDATGAGDLLVAAYIWADQLGVTPSDRLRWAVIYATLSVATPTAVAGAVSLQRLLEEGARAGLSAPDGAATNVG
jgi:sugar/nucleoside kinase (ribokinase family)